MFAQTCRLSFVAIYSLLLLSACTGGGGSNSAIDAGEPGAILQRVTAEWLAQQPGVASGEYSFRLLDADNRPLPWRGLEVEREGNSITIVAPESPPEDVYLYVVYPGERLAFDTAELAEGRAADYLNVAVPGRIDNVLALGLARVGASRGRSLPPGALLRLRFAEGRERVYRATSAVSDDAANAVTLSLGPASGGTVQLSWEERNLGDYDNNGVVTISDLTPLGANLGKSVAGDPKLLLIDGDENGALTIADIGKIGKNFNTQLAGYVVKRTPSAEFSISRADVFSQTPEALRKQRLQYVFNAPFVPGQVNQYTIVPVDNGGAEGPPSNTVSFDAAASNQPPVWDAAEGITSVTPITGGLSLTFGSASDPEGGSVEYVLRYNVAPKDPGAADGTEVVLPAAGGPPFSYDLTGLTPGATYNLRLRARDEQGLHSTNTATQSGTVPMLGLSADPWSSERGNGPATGSNPAASVQGPLQSLWSVDVFAGDVGYTTFSPVVGANGRIYVMEPGGPAPYVIDSSGALLTSPAGVPSSTGTLALAGNTLISSNNQGISIFNLVLQTGTLAATQYIPTGDVLQLGSYGVSVGDDGINSVLTPTASQEWTFGVQQLGPYTRQAVSDGSSIWHASDSNRVVRINAQTGQQQALRNDLLFSLPAFCPPLLDTANRILYLLGSDRIVALDADSLSTVGEYPLAQINTSSTLTYIGYSTPLLLLATTFDSGTETGTLHALDASDPAGLLPLWTSSFGQTTRLRVTAGADRIYAGQGRNLIPDSNILRVLEFDGSLRQNLEVGGQIESEPIPAGDRVYLVVEEQLHAFTTATNNQPPVWQGISAKPGGGIRALSELNGDITVEWDYAVDDLGAPVYYAIYWRQLLPPDFDGLSGGTNVITDIADNGTGSHSFTFPAGTTQRVYVGVRAYDAPWDESPEIDTNTNWLAVTPGWEREELVLGSDLPAGEIYFMRGDTRANGSLGIIYNDEASTELTYLFGTTASWSVEQSALDTWPTPGFDLFEGAAGALVGICDDDAAVLARTAPNTWSRNAVQGSTQPGLNPQISLIRSGANGALAYTQHIGGSFPDPETHYWASFFSGGTWQPAIEIDDQNFSGRDIAMLLSGTDPLALYQLGLTYAPNRLTPQRGLLRMALWNGSDWDLPIVDPGLNTDDNPLTVESDCGKRVRAVTDSTGLVHLAYLDLDASASLPRAQLKYALLDPVNLTVNISVRSTIDLSFQPGSMQFTWGELGLVLVNDEPVISYLQRETTPSDSLPHFASAWLWDHRDGTNWVQTRLSDSELVFPADREPCVLLLDGSGKLHLFYASTTTDVSGQADMLVHVYER